MTEFFASRRASETCLGTDDCRLIGAKSVSALIPLWEESISSMACLLVGEVRGSFLRDQEDAMTAGPR